MPLPPYLLHIFTQTQTGEPMENPTWGLLGDADIDFLVCAVDAGVILLGEQSPGEYLVDPADIGLDYNVCKAYLSARDQYATLASETDLYSLTADPATRHFQLAVMTAQKAIRDTAFGMIDAVALNVTEAHRTQRYITL